MFNVEGMVNKYMFRFRKVLFWVRWIEIDIVSNELGKVE